MDAGSSRGGQIPQFLNKLSAMVDDPATDKFIKWSDDGTSFYVLNPDQFAKELLGTYYKTDASASFVRQLNMYGFHKVPHVRQGALKSDKQAQAWHYKNPNFRKGRPDLLPFIARKGKGATGPGISGQLQSIKQSDLDQEFDLSLPPTLNTAVTTTGPTEVTTPNGTKAALDMNQVINGLATIKRHQSLISDSLKELRSSNDALWQEAMAARERHRKHQDTINRILKFLASLFQGTATAPVRSASMSSTTSAQESAVPVIARPRLMIKGPETDENHDEVMGSPANVGSVRLEELLDDDFPSNSAADSVSPDATPTNTKPTSKIGTDHLSGAAPAPTPDVSQLFGGGAPIIPPADAWRMLQWLQQNQINIPGFNYANSNLTPNNGALTSTGANMGVNPFAYNNVFGNGMGSNNTNYPSSNGAATQPSPMFNFDPNVNQSMYTNNLPNSSYNLFPSSNSGAMIGQVPDDPLPGVVESGDKLDRLSYNVDAMQQGIESLINGLQLQPEAVANLRGDGNTTTDPVVHNVYEDNTGHMNTSADLYNTGLGDNSAYPMPDMDLDTLLKQLGAAVTSSFDPSAIPPTDSSQNNNTGYHQVSDNSNFDPIFGDMLNLGDNGSQQFQQQQQQNGAGGLSAMDTLLQSGAYLNEIPSPMKGVDAATPTEETRPKTRKRKPDSPADTPGDGTTGTSRGSRATKRRK